MAGRQNKKVVATSERSTRDTRPTRASAIANREAILRAALDIFSRFGFDGSSTRTIAAAAGIEQGHLVYYFKSKEGLWREVVEAFAHECEQPLREIAPRLERDNAAAVARDVLPRFLTTFASNPQLTRLMLQEFSVSSPRHDWLIETFGRPVWRLVEPLLEALRKHGLLSGAVPAVAYFNMIGGALLVFGSLDEIREISGENAAEMAVQHIELLLQPIFARA